MIDEKYEDDLDDGYEDDYDGDYDDDYDGKDIRPKRKEQHSSKRIRWAQGLSNLQICDILQEKLMTSRAQNGMEVSLLNELAHEIKFRLTNTKWTPKGYRND